MNDSNNRNPLRFAPYTNALAARKCLIVGHRGAAGLAPENTLLSFRTAFELGCPMVELDVHRVANKGQEDSLAVIHDERVDRTTDGHGLVSEFDFAGLRSLRCEKDQLIPTLNEVLTLLIAQGDAPAAVNIELKGPHTAALVAKTLLQFPDTAAIISSFSWGELNAFRQYDTTTPVALLVHRWNDEVITKASSLNATAIHLADRIVTNERVDMITRAGMPSGVYTVNEVARAQALQKMGVAAVFTDRPDLLLGQI